MDQIDLLKELQQLRQKHLPLNKEIISAIDKKIGFEVLISGISAKFAASEMENIEKEIEDGLRMIVEFFDLGRSTLFSFSDDRSKFVSKYCYARGDITVIKTEMGADLFPQVFKLLLNGEFIWFNSYDDLHEDFSKDIKNFKKTQLKAGFIVPILSKNPPSEKVALNCTRWALYK